LTDSVSRVTNNGTWIAATLWTLVDALLAAVLLAATLATFNRCLGRVSNRTPARPAWRPQLQFGWGEGNNLLNFNDEAMP
jgi:hypothetical protein